MEKKLQHTFEECAACATEHRLIYIQLRKNHDALVKFQDDYVQVVNVAAPRLPPQLNAEEKHSLIKKRVEKIGEAAVAATHRAVMSNDVSFQKLQNRTGSPPENHIHMTLTTM